MSFNFLQFDHVIFDFDGTLYDSHESVHQLNLKILEKFSSHVVTLEELKQNPVFSFAQLFDVYPLRNENDRSQAISEWYAEAQSHQSTTLFEGVPKLLRQIHGQGTLLSIWTARDQASTIQVLRHNGLEGLFTTINGSTIQASKPSLESLPKDFLLNDFENTILVGDSPTDQRCAINLRCRFGLADWARQSPDEDFQMKAVDYIFGSPLEILEKLKFKAYRRKDNN